MHVSVTGLSHQTAPVALRERFAFTPEALPPALEQLRAVFGGAAILSTCNRSEVYLASPTPPRRDEVVAVLAAATGEAVPEGIEFLHYEGAAAAGHLFRVAAGIESLVVGESEILGQVRAAFSAATAAHSSNAVLARLFHSAIRVGRRARSESEIGAHGLSVSAIAVAFSRQALGDLRRKTILVVGAGDAGRLAAEALAKSSAGRLLVTTRRSGRAEEIASELNGISFPFDELAGAIKEADIVISSTAAPDFVVSREAVAAAMAARPDRPLAIVDIAVPRDVEPAVREIAGVQLFDIDDLQAAAESNEAARRAELPAVEAIVAEEQARFGAWLASIGVVPTIATLRRQAEAARELELARTLPRLTNLSDEDRRRVEAMSKALVKRLLHGPVTYLKEPGGEQHLEAARDLFGLDESGG